MSRPPRALLRVLLLPPLGPAVLEPDLEQPDRGKEGTIRRRACRWGFGPPHSPQTGLYNLGSGQGAGAKASGLAGPELGFGTQAAGSKEHLFHPEEGRWGLSASFPLWLLTSGNWELPLRWARRVWPPEGVWFLVGSQAGSAAPPRPSWLLTAPVLSRLPGLRTTSGWAQLPSTSVFGPLETESKARFGGFP